MKNTSNTGLEAVAAFRNGQLTPNSLRNSSYLSAEVRSYFQRYFSASAMLTVFRRDFFPKKINGVCPTKVGEKLQRSLTEFLTNAFSD